MAREKMFDPGFQKAFTEAIHKENKIRMKWYLENVGKTQSTKIDPDEEESESDEEGEIQPVVAPQARKVKFDVHIETEKSFKKPEEEKQELSWPASKGTTSITRAADPPSVMRSVDPKVKLLLYQGVSHEEQGRKQYLRKRSTVDPEIRYRFPICSSWEYGWKYGLKLDEPTQSEYGRRQIIKESFYRPNDPQLKPKD